MNIEINYMVFTHWKLLVVYLFPSTDTVVHVLKKHFVGLCHCLPKDPMVTLQRLKYKELISDRTALQLAQLPTAEEKNGMIIAVMLGPFNSDVEVLGFCDLLEDVVDSDASKKFIHNLRAGMDFVEFKWSFLCGLVVYKVNKY